MLKLRCFGGVVPVDETGEELTLRSRKHLGLLLYLVAHPRTTHTRKELAYLLWDGAGKRARHSLSQALYDIRSALGPVLDVDTHTVRLRPRRIAYEVSELERAVRDYDHRTALELYRGEFATNLLDLGAEAFERWLDTERESCRVLAALALRNAQRAAEERGEWDDMCLAALRLIKHNEFDEEAHCALMRGLWLKGDSASALEHYREVRRRWGVHAAETVEIGVFADRLKALDRRYPKPSSAPERLWGRHDLLKHLLRQYNAVSSQSHAIVLWGPPGIGKTALVRRFARIVCSRRITNPTHFTLAVSDGPAHTQVRAPLKIADQNLVPATSLVEMGNRPYDRPQFVLITSRRRPDHSDVSAPSVEIVEVPGLTDQALMKLLARRYPALPQALVDAVTRWSGGNPRSALAIAEAAIRRSQLPSHSADEAAWIDRLLADRALAHHVAQLGGNLSTDERTILGALAPLSSDALARAEGLLESNEVEDFQGLVRAGILIRQPNGFAFGSPLLKQAGLLLRDRKARQVRQRFASVLLRGSLDARVAGLVELESLGASKTGSLALDVARKAIAKCHYDVASRAGRIGARASLKGGDCAEAAVIAAEAELAQGREKEGLDLLREIRPNASAPEVRARAALALLRWDAAIPQSERLMLRREVVALLTRLESSPAGPKISLQAAAADLALHMDARDGQVLHDLATGLSFQLEQTKEEAGGFPTVWAEGARTLFEYHARRIGAADAETVLHRYASVLASLPTPIPERALLWRAYCHYHRGRLRDALNATTAVLSALPSQPSRLASIATNNAGVMHMECGEHDAAEALFGRAGRIEEALAAPPSERVKTTLNRVQRSFYDGQHAKIRRLGQTVDPALGPKIGRTAWSQRYSLEGLSALQRRDLRTAEEIAERLPADARETAWADDGYLVVWFRAATRFHLRGENPVGYLEECAEELAAVDALGAWKLRVLAGHFRDDDVRRALQGRHRAIRAAGAGWFVSFSKTWYEESGGPGTQ